MAGVWDPFALVRAQMVEEQLERRGITDARVLGAMREVPRHLFVEEALRGRAYGDYPSSAPFPETLPGGSDYWGWVRLGVSPKRVPAGTTMTLIFHDVAANHYRDVRDLTIRLNTP